MRFITYKSNNLITFKLCFFIIIFFYIKNYIFYSYSLIDDKVFKKEKEYYENFLLLKDKPLDFNNSLIDKEKNDILKIISNEVKKNITFINSICFITNFHFGNSLVLLNKYIFYCEIIKCKSIILDKKTFWFINNKITLSSNITIEVHDLKKYNNSNILFFQASSFFFVFFNIKPEIRIHLLRKEILNNLPRLKINSKDLYIHIRSGDIFTTSPTSPYAQPPLCFYIKIIENFKFRNIYIISSGKDNPVIPKLINEYSNIIFNNKSTIKIDIALLINAYFIVASVSSFFISSIQLNYNLMFLWEYNIYKISQKIKHFHFDLYKFPNRNYSIFRMDPSNIYTKVMLKWKNNRKQRKLMIKEKCQNFFRVIGKQI